MVTDHSPLPEYEKPPVIETVCGVLFQELTLLHAVHLGSLWQKLKPDYDHSREVAPLAPAVERLDEPSQVQLKFTDVPPLPRTWLLTPNENGIIQVQRDRFLHNWKKVAPEDEYPRYTRVIQMFRDKLQTFEQFLAEDQLGSIEPRQYEMTYVNHIPQGDGWTDLADAGNVLPDFTRRKAPSRFLSEPDQVNWRTSFLLPDTQGRLHTVIRHIHRPSDPKPILLLELTARGFPADTSRDSMWAWFDLAHEWIVNGFTDLTSEQVRKNVWRQTR
jgi:uncharacterized protein (TIGR04255 family)